MTNPRPTTIHELARRGGVARARRLSPERRRAIARLGGLAGGRGRSKAGAGPALSAGFRARLAALAPSAREGWYLAAEIGQPKTAAQARILLDAMMKHGTLEQYRRAGALRRDLDRFHDTEAELNVAYRFFPLVKHRRYGRMLSPFDLATNKLLTMAGRFEVRDWVDLLLCHRRVQPLGLLAYAACGKDPGFSPLQLIEYAARCTRYTQVELDSLAFRGPAPTLADLHRDWHRAVEQARELLAILPPEHAGKCVRQKRGLFRGTPAALRRALAAGELTFHSGRLDAVLAVPTGLLVNPVPLVYPK